MAISKEVINPSSIQESYVENLVTHRSTNRFSTGSQEVNNYLGGGFGKHNGHELMVIYGATGSGKSTFGLQILSHSMVQGTKVALMSLEDRYEDVLAVVHDFVGDIGMEQIFQSSNVELFPKQASRSMWSFEDILEWVRHKIQDRGCEIVYIDHMQFMYENATYGETKVYDEHRKFNKNLVNLLEDLDGTAVVISHVNKSTGGVATDKMIGSGSLANAATKAIEVENQESPLGLTRTIKLTKSRYTDKQSKPFVLRSISR